MATEDSKTCSRCGETKPQDGFPSNGRGGKRADCKVCHAAYIAERRRADPDKARAVSRKSNRRAYAQDPEKFKARSQAWRKANPEKHVAISIAWAKANRDKVRENGRRWSAANPDKTADSCRRRRMRLKGREAGNYTRREIYDRDGGVCRMCGVTLAFERHAFHIDHIVPLSLGGPDHPSNVQLTCPPCNWTKNAHLEGQIQLPV